MTTTAEGIEDETQLQVVRDQGCTDLQGYYFSRPRPAGDVNAMLEDLRRRAIRSAPRKSRQVRA
jgi:EAL domain-containing protein (putative c-di-GMP-specific phosphodiesterase class I)